MTQLRSKPDQRLDLVVAGTKDAVMMVESEAYELSEAEMLGAVKFGHDADAAGDRPDHRLCRRLARKSPSTSTPPDYSALYAKVKKAGEKQMRAAFAIRDKQERTTAISAAVDADQGGAERRRSGRRQPRLGDQEAGSSDPARRRRRRAAPGSTGATPRPCARSSAKPASCRAPTARRCSPVGETQGLVVTTLGTGEDEQIIDALHGN